MDIDHCGTDEIDTDMILETLDHIQVALEEMTALIVALQYAEISALRSRLLKYYVKLEEVEMAIGEVYSALTAIDMDGVVDGTT